jgi:hypothetical protein
MTSFEFVFILHLMKEIIQITDHLCQVLQSKSQDILSVMRLVSSTKRCINDIEMINGSFTHQSEVILQ